MSDIWNSTLFSQPTLPPFTLLENVFKLSRFVSWPNAAGLNQLKSRLSVDMNANFVDQSKLVNETAYYEQIIYEKSLIPTRENNWHDLFNGLIWLLFPRTKTLFNRLHIEDINQFGLSPRSTRRNQITHFDECGIVLVYEDDALPSSLAAHQWRQSFVDERLAWGNRIDALVFGHANLEMLLNPFIGLTGKWLAVKVKQDYWTQSPVQRFQTLDAQLHSQLIEQSTLDKPKPLKPIPLLGIPGWWDANADGTFYDNISYFRPLRTKAQ